MDKRLQSERGMALAVALIFVSIAIVVLTAMTTRVLSQRTLVNRYQVQNRAMEGAMAALAECKVELENGGDGIVGMSPTWTPVYSSNKVLNLPDLTNGQVMTPRSMASMASVQYAGYSSRWGANGRDDNGDGVVDDAAEQGMISVYTEGKDGDNTRKLEVVYASSDVNVWRNAIFAGSGQSGGLINGNVSIHGSVHLLGNNLNMGIAAVDAIDLSGTSLIHNNYADVPSNLGPRVPALPTTNFGGETISTLFASLRVKKGLVGTSGNSEIGEPNVTGNSYKETMDGVYVNDGYTGTAVTPDGGRGDPQHLYSDNGWDNLYDLGSKVPFPLLTDPWRDPITGAYQYSATKGRNYTHEEYFNEVLVASPTNPTDGVFNGTMTIDTSKNFYWNATQNVQSTTLPGTLPPSTDDYVMFNASTNVMQISGQIKVAGDLNITGKGNDRTINYSGRGCFLAYNNVTIDSDLVTCNGGNPANTANSFPVNNCIGIMAYDTLTVGATAHCDIMGAFYGQNKVVSAKQTNVMGTFVGNYFDMGTNVPAIWQVPTLADNLPMGMIGNYPIMVISQVSWREL